MMSVVAIEDMDNVVMCRRGMKTVRISLTAVIRVIVMKCNNDYV
jgi:hypothetical protein